jgi:hypothetical protein
MQIAAGLEELVILSRVTFRLLGRSFDGAPRLRHAATICIARAVDSRPGRSQFDVVVGRGLSDQRRS